MPPSLDRTSRPLVYAHRGGAALRPENTLAAFDHGLALGADGLEFDVRFSRDGIVVVHHDATLERTTGGRGHVADRTADELAAIDAGYWFQAATSTDGSYPFRGEGIGVPTLGTVLTRYRDARLIIELKLNEPELAHRVIDEVKAADAVDRVALGAFGWRVLRAARKYEPAIPTGASGEETRWALYRSWVGWPLGRTAYREFQVPERSGTTTIVTPRFVAHAHRAGVPVKVWTVNDPADMRRLLQWGADALISDRPDVAVGVVDAYCPTSGPRAESR
ncbi:MAG TPA: glycerophosphodiester phosphodiesterase [Vicinamibacterales bacterium]|nr:glycerophosphodiester phosphodiesterase [Vicinamibacterales bacterium]